MTEDPGRKLAGALLRDHDIREIVRKHVMTKIPPVKGECRHIEEMSLSVAGWKDYIIADYIIIKRSFIMGIEIKSDVDTLQRLEKQKEHYGMICDYMMLVTTEKYAKAAARKLPDFWSIAIIDDTKTFRKLRPVGNEVQNYDTSPRATTDLLYKPEAAEYIAQYSTRSPAKIEKGANSNDLRTIIKDYMIPEHGAEPLCQFVREKLLARTKRQATFNTHTGRPNPRRRDTG